MPPLDGRDFAVVQLVARFKQLSSRHVRELLFNEHKSHTPLDRTLRRLVAHSFLFIIERRVVGGSHGGSGQYVYQLGRRGFVMFNGPGRYQPSRAVNFHSLAIADCYVELRKMERAGRLSLAGMSTEPDCWAEVGGVTLKPDMLVEVVKPSTERLKLWLEVDMGTEQQRQLKGKLEAYWRAYNDADVNAWPVFPRVLWVAVDAERGQELRWLIEQGPKDAQMLFNVTTLAELATFF